MTSKSWPIKSIIETDCLKVHDSESHTVHVRHVNTLLCIYIAMHVGYLTIDIKQSGRSAGYPILSLGKTYRPLARLF